VRRLLLEYFPSYAEQTHSYDLGVTVRAIYNFVVKMLREPGFAHVDHDERRIITDALKAYGEMEDRVIAQAMKTLGPGMIQEFLDSPVIQRVKWDQWNERFLAQTA